MNELVIREFVLYAIAYMYDMRFFTMKALSYTALRKTLAKTMEKVCDDHEPIVITRKSEGAVVMLSLEDYESLEETTYLLRSPKNVKRLFESISQLEEGKGVEKDLVE
ncbi:MAG: YoeB-YefM toxin-antitoxin system antitoxin YefM [Gammaproteobacteria bacterium]|nr:MAG: YoeB-YefM toxin-antitoxin system antitoxin YefM [Gammaproteobacteria bacterium]